MRKNCRGRTSKCPTSLVFVCLLALQLTPDAALADSCTWDGSTGNWNDSGRWSCGHEPGASDSATIGGGVVNVTVSATVETLSQSGGTLQGAANVEITNQLTWSSGVMDGSGQTIVPDGATASLSVGGGVLTLNRDFDNRGTLTWSGQTHIFGSKSTFTNLGTGTVTIAADTNYTFGNTSTMTFANQGTITQTSGKLNKIGAVFNQTSTGSTEVQSGTLRLENGAASTVI